MNIIWEKFFGEGYLQRQRSLRQPSRCRRAALGGADAPVEGKKKNGGCRRPPGGEESLLYCIKIKNRIS